ncbi:LOW QUALITY PROTEIN: uncharacterized protein FYW47_007199 [Aplochiton taeniatus]
MTKVDRKRSSLEEDCHGNPEIERLRKEVQETMEMNKKLREQLQEDPKTRSLAEERHTQALQALERQAQEDLKTEKSRLQTLQDVCTLYKQRAELTQQHTEWSRQMTQRHMKQIEDLKAELQTHTQMMALQQDLKQQNQWQVFERQLDESRCALAELQRENAALKEQQKDSVTNPKDTQEEGEGGEKEERRADTPRKRDSQLEEESQRLKEKVERLTEEMERLEETQKRWQERREENTREAVARREEEEERRRRTEEERRRAEVEEIQREHKREIQGLVSDYSSADYLQARIVALETELREREEKCKEPRSDDLQLGRLQDKLTEGPLIKRLVEEKHQLQLHPPVAGDNSTLRLHDNKSRPGSVTPTMRHSSSTLPHPATSQPHPSIRYSSSSLPHRHASLAPSQHSSPSLPRSMARSSAARTCSPPQAGIRYGTSSYQDSRPHLPGQPIRSPYLEQRAGEAGTDERGQQNQEWFTKYFSF